MRLQDAPLQKKKAISTMSFEWKEVQGDLFCSSDCLCHCVSEDLNMGKGIAVAFKEKFKSVEELKKQQVKMGGVAILQTENRFIYYLVTKVRYYHKPTYDSVRKSLEAMRAHIIQNNVVSLSMPKIAAGLDGLEWDKVKEIIFDVFSQVQIKITMFTL